MSSPPSTRTTWCWQAPGNKPAILGECNPGSGGIHHGYRSQFTYFIDLYRRYLPYGYIWELVHLVYRGYFPWLQGLSCLLGVFTMVWSRVPNCTSLCTAVGFGKKNWRRMDGLCCWITVPGRIRRWFRLGLWLNYVELLFDHDAKRNRHGSPSNIVILTGATPCGCGLPHGCGCTCD